MIRWLFLCVILLSNPLFAFEYSTTFYSESYLDKDTSQEKQTHYALGNQLDMAFSDFTLSSAIEMDSSMPSDTTGQFSFTSGLSYSFLPHTTARIDFDWDNSKIALIDNTSETATVWYSRDWDRGYWESGLSFSRLYYLDNNRYSANYAEIYSILKRYYKHFTHHTEITLGLKDFTEQTEGKHQFMRFYMESYISKQFSQEAGFNCGFSMNLCPGIPGRVMYYSEQTYDEYISDYVSCYAGTSFFVGRFLLKPNIAMTRTHYRSIAKGVPYMDTEWSTSLYADYLIKPQWILYTNQKIEHSYHDNNETYNLTLGISYQLKQR